MCCLSSLSLTTPIESSRFSATMSNSNALIKDTLLKLNRNNKLLESRKSKDNLLKNSPPSIRTIATSRSSKNSSTTPKTPKRHSNYRQE